jgi:AraC-like DNA-binding protein
MGIPLHMTWTRGGFGAAGARFGTAQLPEEIGHFSHVQHRLRPGLQVCAFDAVFHEPVTLSAKILIEEPTLWIGVSFSGSGAYRHGDVLGAVTPGGSYCALLRDAVTEFAFAPGHHVATGLIVTQSRLRDLVREQKIHRAIDDFLAGPFEPSVQCSHSAMALRNIASQITNHPYCGPAEALFLEAKAHEILAEAFRLFDGDCPKDGSSRMRRDAYAARDIVMADLANPPRIADLAAKVGLSQRRLGEAFHLVFNASPLECLVQWRMDVAYRLLSSGGLTVKQVSEQVGYAHVSNFSLAFSRRFGHPPSSTPE